MNVYAKGTEVPVVKSRTEIEAMLSKYGAKAFASGWLEDRAIIACEIRSRQIRFELPIPAASDKRFNLDGNRRPRTAQSRAQVHDAELRRLWRALCLIIKAKLESVHSGIETFEQAFLANIVVPGTGGRTFGEWAIPQIAESYDRGAKMPPLLGPGPSA